MATHTVPGAWGEKYGRDPTMFAINLVKAEQANLAKLTRRCSDRTGINKWTTKPDGKQAFQSSMRANNTDSPVEIAWVLCLWTVKNPGVLIEEAARMAAGQPVGKGLDGKELPKQVQAYTEIGDGITGLIPILLLGIPLLVLVGLFALGPLALLIPIGAVIGGIALVAIVAGGASGKANAEAGLPTGVLPQDPIGSDALALPTSVQDALAKAQTPTGMLLIAGGLVALYLAFVWKG